MTAVAVAHPVSRSFPRVALLALAAGAFVMCTAEFVIAGLLPEVAADLGVGISTAGLLISGYAAAIVVGGPVFVVAGTRVPRTRLLVIAAAVFVVGNTVAALSGTYSMLMTGRVLSALGQGAFLATASVVAADLVPSELRARAIAGRGGARRSRYQRRQLSRRSGGRAVGRSESSVSSRAKRGIFSAGVR